MDRIKMEDILEIAKRYGVKFDKKVKSASIAGKPFLHEDLFKVKESTVYITSEDYVKIRIETESRNKVYLNELREEEISLENSSYEKKKFNNVDASMETFVYIAA